MYSRKENPGRYWCQGSTPSSVLLRPFRKFPSSPIAIISLPYSCVLLILHNTSRSGLNSRRGLPLGGRSLGEKPICTICPASQSLPLQNRLDPFRHQVNFGNRRHVRSTYGTRHWAHTSWCRSVMLDWCNPHSPCSLYKEA